LASPQPLTAATPRAVQREHRLPQRHLIAYGTEHDGLDPFLPKGSRRSSRSTAPVAGIATCRLSGRSNQADLAVAGPADPSPPRTAAMSTSDSRVGGLASSSRARAATLCSNEDQLTRGPKSSVLPVDKVSRWAYTECHRGNGRVEWARSDGRLETVFRAREGSRCDGLERRRVLWVDVGRRRVFAYSDLICPGDYHMLQGVCHRKGGRGR